MFEAINQAYARSTLPQEGLKKGNTQQATWDLRQLQSVSWISRYPPCWEGWLHGCCNKIQNG